VTTQARAALTLANSGRVSAVSSLDPRPPDDGRVGSRRRRHARRAEPGVVEVGDQLPDDLQEVVAVFLELTEAVLETT